MLHTATALETMPLLRFLIFLTGLMQLYLPQDLILKKSSGSVQSNALQVLDIEQLSIISPVSSQEPAFIDFIKIALHNSVTHFVHLDIFKFSVIEFQLFSSFVFLM